MPDRDPSAPGSNVQPPETPAAADVGGPAAPAGAADPTTSPPVAPAGPAHAAAARAAADEAHAAARAAADRAAAAEAAARSIAGDPTARSGPAAVHWRAWHTWVLLGLTAVGVGLGIWRPLALYPSWIVTMIACLAFVLVAGHGIKGIWRGAFVDERNKVSLSRVQVFAWTIVVVSALGVIGVARALELPSAGFDVEVPANVWLLLGISGVSSLVGAPLIKNTKKERGLVDENRTERQARWSDLFLGEEKGNASYLDVSKVQLFLFTVLLVLTYAVAIGALLHGKTLPESLPQVEEGVVALLGLSHAGYLAGKAVGTTATTAPDTPRRS